MENFTVANLLNCCESGKTQKVKIYFIQENEAFNNVRSEEEKIIFEDTPTFRNKIEGKPSLKVPKFLCNATVLSWYVEHTEKNSVVVIKI